MEIVVRYRLRVDGTWELHEIETPVEVGEEQQEGLYQAAVEMERKIQTVLAARPAA